MWTKIQLIFHTVIHLKWIQIQYQVFYRIRGKLGIKPSSKAYISGSRNHLIIGQISASLFNDLIQFRDKKVVFKFLNLNQEFDRDSIDWNFDEYGKLWTYNLNYFEFLLSDHLSYDEGILLIESYINNWDNLKDGLEPFPISLRTINWIKFLSKHDVRNDKIDERLYHQVQLLLNNLEYHLLANHLLENAFALIFAAYYFQDEEIYAKAKLLLLQELDEQILNDGAHFERSPMYHQLMLFRLLDVVSIVENNTWKNQEMLMELKPKAQAMVNWLVQMTLPFGDMPYVKDSTTNIAPKNAELLVYAKSHGLDVTMIGNLKESGYRWLESGNAKLLVDVGQVSPSYQPGHAHADELNFLLYKNGEPIIVDTGISTYQKNGRRQLERSTSSHNCVVINNENSSKVWGGFRVAKRAKVIVPKDNETEIEASHDGYSNLGIEIIRRFSMHNKGFTISNEIIGANDNHGCLMYIHFDHKQNVSLSASIIHLPNLLIDIDGHEKITLEDYQQAIGFNRFKTSKRTVIRIKNTSTINLKYAN